MPDQKEESLKKAVKKIGDYLSHRSHSEKELVDKLKSKFPFDIIEKALEKAKQNNWLEKPEELSLKVLEKLHNKNKSWEYIKSYLKEKSLPLPEYDKDREIEKMKRLVVNKKIDLADTSYKNKMKIKQFLAYRGFESSIIDEWLEELSAN